MKLLGLNIYLDRRCCLQKIILGKVKLCKITRCRFIQDRMAFKAKSYRLKGYTLVIQRSTTVFKNKNQAWACLNAANSCVCIPYN